MVTVCHAQLLPILGFVKVSHITLSLTLIITTRTSHWAQLLPDPRPVPVSRHSNRMSNVSTQSANRRKSFKSNIFKDFRMCSLIYRIEFCWVNVSCDSFLHINNPLYSLLTFKRNSHVRKCRLFVFTCMRPFQLRIICLNCCVGDFRLPLGILLWCWFIYFKSNSCLCLN